MSKSVQKLLTQNPSSSVLATEKENSLETRIKRLESIEKELDQIFIDDQHLKIEADKSLYIIKKNLKKLKNIVSQYEKQQILVKRPSFSDQQQHSEPKVSRTMFEDWQKLSVEEHILASPMISNLLLGYDLLNIDLRNCLQSLAFFPENAIIKKRPLIYWWMAEAFIKKSDEKSVEDVGEFSFRELVNKGMIQPRSKNDKVPMVYSCTLHPWIRSMLVYKARQAKNFYLDGRGRISCSFLKSRCLCLPIDDNGSSSEGFRTVFNVNESYFIFDEDFLSDFRMVKILQLGSWHCSPYHHIKVENDKFLNGLWKLKHLKYLSLRGISRITTLPSSITECFNLEILDLKCCYDLERVPSNFGSLRKLTHLDFSKCYLLGSMPHNQHKLLWLQVLKGFDAEKYASLSHRSYYQIPTSLPFSKLQYLKKLSVILGTRKSPELADDLRWLFSIKNLSILTLTWKMDSTKHVKQSEQEEKYDGEEDEDYRNLENLEKLELRFFPFRKRPFWLSPNILKNLKRLYVRGGLLEELIPKITSDDAGNVTDCWNVEMLRLRHLKNLKLTSDRVNKFFPRLSYFEIVVSHQKDTKKYDVDLWWKAHQGLEKFPQFEIKS